MWDGFSTRPPLRSSLPSVGGRVENPSHIVHARGRTSVAKGVRPLLHAGKDRQLDAAVGELIKALRWGVSVLLDLQRIKTANTSVCEDGLVGRDEAPPFGNGV